MTNSLANEGEVTSCRSCSASISCCVRRSRVDAIADDLSTDTETKENNVLPDFPSSLSNLITSTTKAATLEPNSDGVSDKGTIYPAASLVSTSSLSASTESDSVDWIYAECFGPCKKIMLGQDTAHDTEKHNHAMEVIVDGSNGAKPVCCLSTSNGTSCTPLHENCDARDSDVACELFSTSNPTLFHTCGSRQSPRIFSDPMDEAIKEDIACNSVSVSHFPQDSCSVVLQYASSDNLGGNIGMVTIAEYPVVPMEPDAPFSCESGDLVSTVLQVAPESIQNMPEANGASSSHASIMHSDDENVKECEKGRCDLVFRDLEAGLPFEVASSVDEEGMLGVDLAEDPNCSSLVKATKEALPVEAYHDHYPASSCDVKDLVDSELREPLLAHVQTDDTKSSQDKEVLLGGESLEKEAEVHGLRKRRGVKADAIKPSAGSDSGPGKMPEEQKKVVTSTRTKDASTDVSQEAKQKPVDKKTGKQGKGAGKPSAAVRKSGDSQPMAEELRAKEEAETNRKVHESLDNFIRQTIRCEPYMNFTSRPGDKPLQRLRPDVFENHVAGKFARGFKVENGSDPRDIATEENRGIDSNSNDVDGLKDGSTGSAKGIAGLGRGAQHSLKVPPGVVAFTQAAAKGTDLQGWLSPSKTKCEKCTREFCSTLNYRRHVRVHRRSLNPEKEDLSKERSKVAAFWDKLTPEEAGSIVYYDNMEIEDLSGQSAIDALKIFIQQPGLPSLPQGILKAGSSLLDIVQNKSSVHLSSERLLGILDDASEKTFLCGGTSIAVQRFVFNGEAGKVGLEEKNLVASMGFHIELKLVKAWMADKEAEALRCQQALFKEEEAAHQKRKKFLEKKRMKKIRQKERKGSTSQLILQELENESIDDEGNVQGIGEEDDSPTGTGSSSSSLASAQDLALPESAELDETDALAPTDILNDQELVLGEKSDTGKNMSSDEDQLHRSRDGLPQYGRERQQIGSHRGEDLYRKEDQSASGAGANFQPRPADQVDWDGDFDSRSGHPSYQSRIGGKIEVQSNLYYRKGEQDRIDFKRRDFERYPTQERRPLRITRERLPRNDYSEQKPQRDARGYDTRYVDGHPTAFKPLRKPNAYFIKSDSGNVDLSSSSRLQQYRSKPPGMMNRPSSTTGNGQVVWTRKVPQPAAAVEATIKDRQEETIHDDAENSSKVDGCVAASEALPEVGLSVPDSAGGDVGTIPDERMEKKEDAAAVPVPLDVVVSTENTFGSDCYSCRTSSLLTKLASFVSSASILMEKNIGSVSHQLCKGYSGTVIGPCSDDSSSDLMKTSLSSVRLQDSRLAGSGDDVISMERMVPDDDDDDEGLSGALLVGSLSVPLGKFATVSLSQAARLAPNASYLHLPDDSEVGNVRAAGSRDESHDLLSSQEAALSSHIYPAIESSSDGSEPLRASAGSRSNPVTATQPVAKLKPHLSSTSPERGENSRQNATAPPLGHDRLAVKPGSWQTSAGRSVPAKVWRAVGVVGERQDSCEARLSQDLDASGRSEGESETSPNAADVRQGGSSTQDKKFLREDSQDGRDPNDDHPVVMKTSDTQSILSAASAPFRPAARSESGLMVQGKADFISKVESDNGVESSISASGFYPLAVYVEIAESFFNERWRAALAQASPDEVLHIASDSFSKGGGLNFLDMVLRQMSKESSRQSPGAAESGPSLSFSVVTELSSKPARDGGVLLSKIFSDFDHTGMEDTRCPSTVDEQGLDGASPQTPSSEDDAGLRDASTSPIASEHYMSGSEMASSAPSARGVKFSESRGGGGAGSSYPRRGNTRQERWHRNSRDSFPEQRYMARRRAPVEKKDC